VYLHGTARSGQTLIECMCSRHCQVPPWHAPDTQIVYVLQTLLSCMSSDSIPPWHGAQRLRTLTQCTPSSSRMSQTTSRTGRKHESPTDSPFRVLLQLRSGEGASTTSRQRSVELQGPPKYCRCKVHPSTVEVQGPFRYYRGARVHPRAVKLQGRRGARTHKLHYASSKFRHSWTAASQVP